MTIRSFQLPQDLDLMNSLVMEGFQYPENPSWSIQADEKQGLIDTINAAKRMWPLIRVIQTFSPVFRDVMRGFIDEEDGKPVGLINFLRQRNVPEWWIGNVTVLPAYRRRGVARQLVQATLDDLRRKKAQMAYLEVVDGNLPAFELYKEMGFAAYAKASQYDYGDNKVLEIESLPAGYSLKSLNAFDWRAKYEFAKCAIPELVKQYEPVLEKRYRVPFIMILIGSLFNTLSGKKVERFAVYNTSGEIVGYGDLSYRLRANGVNQANLRISPDHPGPASFMIGHALSMIRIASPGHRIEIHVEDWGYPLIQALEWVGAEKRLKYHHMGFRFQT